MGGSHCENPNYRWRKPEGNGIFLQGNHSDRTSVRFRIVDINRKDDRKAPQFSSSNGAQARMERTYYCPPMDHKVLEAAAKL